ncbi:MAG: hypothetical protein PHE49_06660 [bacterium]|nr:hypothetical protein [bacterium]
MIIKYFNSLMEVIEFEEITRIAIKDENLIGKLQKQQKELLKNESNNLVDMSENNFAVMLKVMSTENKLREQTFILLFSKFEVHVQRLLYEIYKKEPRILKTKNKKMEYECIINYRDYNSILEHIIRKEISEYDYSPYKNKREYFNKLLDTNFDWCFKKEGFLIEEINEKRNKLLHTDETIDLTEKFLYRSFSYLLWVGMQLFTITNDKFNIENKINDRTLKTIEFLIEAYYHISSLK